MNNKTEYKNEVIKRKYFNYLRQAEGFSEKSIDAFDGAILLWQDCMNNSDFGSFSKKKVMDFKMWLSEKKKVNGT